MCSSCLSEARLVASIQCERSLELLWAPCEMDKSTVSCDPFDKSELCLGRWQWSVSCYRRQHLSTLYALPSPTPTFRSG